LMNALNGEGIQLRRIDEHGLEVTGPDSETIGRRALEYGVVLSELRPLQRTLEDAYMELTRDAVEYHSNTVAETGGGK